MGTVLSLVVGYLLVGTGFALGRKHEHRGARNIGLSIVAWPVAVKDLLS